MPSVDNPDRIRLVIVEDHAFVREGTRRLLELESDIEVVGEASTGQEAVELAQTLQPDLILMDISLPEMDGIEATQRIHVLSPRIPIVGLTAYDDDQYVFALLDAGAAGYLLKDVGREQLVAAIRSVALGESVLHPAIAQKVFQRYATGAKARDQDSALSPLSERELEVLRAAACGLANEAIALELGVSIRTVQAHMSHIFDKTNTSSRTQAVIEALRRQWIRLEELTFDVR